jgi:mono/diheme cytochrome c family protein
MKRAMMAGGLAALCASAALAAPVAYTPPAETARFAPGPGVEVAQANCMICHSVDYVITQPRTFPDPKAFWSGEVAKMKKVYGAPFRDADAQAIVDYLAAAYGRDEAVDPKLSPKSGP